MSPATPFWYRWIPAWAPTDLVEGVGGALLGGLAGLLAWFAWLHPVWFALLLASAVSVEYERTYDPNGWSWRDVLGREAAIVVVLAAWAWVYR